MRNFRYRLCCENVEPMGYKAMLVAVDREACALYKEALDRCLPAEYSEVVISHGHNAPPLLAACHYSEEEEERIRKAFRKPGSLPRILIVTEKLLTGFDAPIHPFGPTSPTMTSSGVCIAWYAATSIPAWTSTNPSSARRPSW